MSVSNQRPIAINLTSISSTMDLRYRKMAGHCSLRRQRKPTLGLMIQNNGLLVSRLPSGIVPLGKSFELWNVSFCSLELPSDALIRVLPNVSYGSLPSGQQLC